MAIQSKNETNRAERGEEETETSPNICFRTEWMPSQCPIAWVSIAPSFLLFLQSFYETFRIFWKPIQFIQAPFIHLCNTLNDYDSFEIFREKNSIILFTERHKTIIKKWTQDAKIEYSFFPSRPNPQMANFSNNFHCSVQLSIIYFLIAK